MTKNILKSLIILILLPQVSLGAIIYPSPDKIASESRSYVHLLLDTGEDSVNALRGKISLEVSGIPFKDFEISDAGTFFVWTVEPHINQNSEIEFEGMIPGGFSGNDGNMLTLAINTSNPTVGDGSSVVIKLVESEGYKNDGLATKAIFEIPAQKSEIQISKYIPKTIINERIDDKTPPDFFSTEFARHDEVYDGKYFISFHTTDLQSGIKQYEILEVPRGDSGTRPKLDNNWEISKSPYILKDQSLGSDVYVKAVDKAGNFIVVKTILPEKQVIPSRSYVIIVIVLVCLVGVMIYYRRR